MSFTIDYKFDGPWNRDFSVRSSNKGKMKARLFWSSSHISISKFEFHKVERADRPAFVKALIDHLKTMNLPYVEAWFFKGTTASLGDLLTPLGFKAYRDDQHVLALHLVCEEPENEH
jgi:hypothetical protein